MENERVFLYHITPKKNLKSIAEYGLKPGGGVGVSNPYQYKWEYLWLTNNVHYIYEKQLHDSWISEFKPRVLKVDVTNIDVIPKILYDFKNQCVDVCRHEFVTKETIDPSNIVDIIKLDNFLRWNKQW